MAHGARRRAGVVGLRMRWSSLWRRLGSAEPPEVDGLLSRWREPHRAYHTIAHLRHCLAIYDRNPLRDDRVELALWYHDAIYDPRAQDNEERSAALMRAAASAAGIPAQHADIIAGCILATRHREPPADAAQALTLDVDLSILGASRQRFDRYDRAVRAEYDWVPDEIFRRERGRVLACFARRPDLYATTWFRRRFLAKARGNLRRAALRWSAAPGGAAPAEHARVER